ncbi:hypothetical protein P171DRAFT_507021 [Karstenula rhodostoma CBS 690.94]|uniref:RING-type domain-containing protein n=1 Tax=Karstenula rhodostoma CBS 690.94 TaxID=1392251 RepID=A0A9P4PQD2_9PLEO|nr:hypothetical protein P171DRAFT_507021 [Karstenula rhodostoma CBS 690.94]
MPAGPYLRSIAVWSIKHLLPILSTDISPNISDCRICQEPFDNDQHIPVRITDVPGCTGHIFGAACLAEWIASSDFPTCPLCRAPLFAVTPRTREIFDIREQNPTDAEASESSAEHDIRLEILHHIILTTESNLAAFAWLASNVLCGTVGKRISKWCYIWWDALRRRDFTLALGSSFVFMCLVIPLRALFVEWAMCCGFWA